MHLTSLHMAHSCTARNGSAAVAGDSWAQNGTATGSYAISEQHSMLHAHAPQKHAPLSAKAPLFDHTARYTPPPEDTRVAPETHGVLLPEDLLEPSHGASCGSNHMVRPPETRRLQPMMLVSFAPCHVLPVGLRMLQIATCLPCQRVQGVAPCRRDQGWPAAGSALQS